MHNDGAWHDSVISCIISVEAQRRTNDVKVILCILRIALQEASHESIGVLCSVCVIGDIVCMRL